MSNFIRNLTRRALLLVPAMLLFSGSTAFAGSFNGLVSPGGRVCLAPQYAANSADAQGTANPGVKFTVNWSSNGGTYYAIYETADFTSGFHAVFNRTYHPSYFPGYYKLCARNNGTKSANVFLNLSTY